MRVDLLPFLPPSGMSRGERRLASSLIRERQNDIASWLKLELLLYANFSPDDWFVTLTYRNEDLPPNWRAAKKNPPACLRVIRETRRPAGLPCGYVYVHEALHGDQRPHHHMVIHAADGDRSLIEAAWRFGTVDIVTIEDFGGYQKLAAYITKEPREKGKPRPGERMWTPSKGLIRPDRIEEIVEDDYQYEPPFGAQPVEAGLEIQSKVPGWIYGEFPRWDMVAPAQI